MPIARRPMAQMADIFGQAGVRRTQRFTVPFNGWAIPPTRWSDQSPFWDIGVAGVMITDTAWFRNPNYHKPTDTVDTLDFSFMAEITLALAAFLRSEGLFSNTVPMTAK